MNLILALCWAAVGAGILAWQAYTSDERLFLSIGTLPRFSAGWLALFLALYNLVRWYTRVLMAQRPRDTVGLHRPHRPRRDPDEPEPEPNPDLDFRNPPTDPPPRGNPPPAGTS